MQQAQALLMQPTAAHACPQAHCIAPGLPAPLPHLWILTSMQQAQALTCLRLLLTTHKQAALHRGLPVELYRPPLPICEAGEAISNPQNFFDPIIVQSPASTGSGLGSAALQSTYMLLK